MKKIIFTLAVLSTVICGNAQIPYESIAPDFKATDINGQQHSLSAYLQAGKSVILEFSSTACGPSWKYLRTESLQDVYNAYGLPGSDEVVVLFIDDDTSVSELKGISVQPTFGNWVAGTPFPIIPDPGLHSLYKVNLVPTLYWICPDGKIRNLQQASAPLCRSVVNVYCKPLTGVKNYVRVLDNTNGFCDKIASFRAKLKNYGTNDVTEATLQLKENGHIIGTKKFNLNIPQFSMATIDFDPININPAATYTTELVNVNGVQNHNPAFSYASLPFNMTTHTGINLQIKVHTYVCPNNMSWEITNSNGTIVAKGGPYGTPGPLCGGPDMNSIVEHKVMLPDAKDCYNLSLIDANGFGWKNYEGNSRIPTPAGIEIFSEGKLIFSKLNVENFGSLLKIENFLTTNDGLINTVAPTKPTIFPNPSHGTIHVNSESQVAVTIFNSFGQTVFTSASTGAGAAIDLSKCESGIYIVKILDRNNSRTLQKLFLTH